MRNSKMDERCYKRAPSPADKKRAESQRGMRREMPDIRSQEYLYPKNECHCDRCVEERFWAYDSR